MNNIIIIIDKRCIAISCAYLQEKSTTILCWWISVTLRRNITRICAHGSINVPAYASTWYEITVRSPRRKGQSLNHPSPKSILVVTSVDPSVRRGASRGWIIGSLEATSGPMRLWWERRVGRRREIEIGDYAENVSSVSSWCLCLQMWSRDNVSSERTRVVCQEFVILRHAIEPVSRG